MKILHTSDWHIGRALYGRKRYEEFESFLAWLADYIEKEGVEVLLVAGDVFDNSTPTNFAQELYYRFLCRVAAPGGRHVVIVAGNHDSPTFLDAPRELLKSLNVHVVGSGMTEPADEVKVITGPAGETRLIVCAVPYLRDRDIRIAEAGESVEDKERKIVEGIRSHYRLVCNAAEQKRAGCEKPVPIVAMGHLFTTGSRTVEGDGVRELYIGSLAQVGKDVFPESIDYLGLGHLHVPQIVGGSELIRYSGSPLPIGFNEAGQEKSLVLVEFQDGAPIITLVPVPSFQELVTLKGGWETIVSGIEGLRARNSNAWLEIVYEGDEVAGNLRERIDDATRGTGLEVLRVKNNRVLERAAKENGREESLDDLDPRDVFARCLEYHAVPEERRPALVSAYDEVVTALGEEDLLAN